MSNNNSSNAGVWVKASERLPESADVYTCMVYENDGNGVKTQYPAYRKFNGTSFLIPENETVEWLDEQPIPVNQDEVWKEVRSYFEDILDNKIEFKKRVKLQIELESKYYIQLKSYPSPTPVQEGLKEMLVMKDYDGEFEVWSREHYNEYISMSVKHGGGSAYKIVSHFNRNDDLLFPKSEKPKVQEGLREAIISFMEWYNKYHNSPEDISNPMGMKGVVNKYLEGLREDEKENQGN